MMPRRGPSNPHPWVINNLAESPEFLSRKCGEKAVNFQASAAAIPVSKTALFWTLFNKNNFCAGSGDSLHGLCFGKWQACSRERPYSLLLHIGGQKTFGPVSAPGQASSLLLSLPTILITNSARPLPSAFFPFEWSEVLILVLLEGRASEKLPKKKKPLSPPAAPPFP